MMIVRGKLGDLWLKMAAFFTRSSKNFTGSTIAGSIIVLRSNLEGPAAASALAHELVHVDQIRRLGWIKMRWDFFLQDMKHGHQKAPMEIEAFQRSSEFLPMAREILEAK